MCNRCIHAPVCGKCKATGGQVGKCEHFAEERRGRWEEWYPGIALIMTGEEKLYRCSACDGKYPDMDGYRYCPNCGARMDEK